MPPSPSEPDVSTIVARTSRSYDALPYTSDPFSHTHPALLGAIARLFAVDSAPLAQARVLELGCAAAGNIIPIAARQPNASFVGIDLSSAQIAAGRTRIARLCLSNIELRCQSLSDVLGRRDAPFDYIICHGVYSWVPGPLRDTILRICRERLSPRGVAMISYNVLPGSRILQALRDCFLMHATPDADPQRRVAEARTLLQFLPEACPSPGPYKDLLTDQAAGLLKSSDDYIAHEYLDDINEPCSFGDFLGGARRYGLEFLAEADVPSMIIGNYPPNMAAAVQKISANQLIATEQYIDMVTGRPFRSTLLIAAERARQIDRRLTSARIEGLHFFGSETLSLTQEPGGITLFLPGGRRMHSNAPPLQDALAHFVSAFPGSCTVDDLVQALPGKARNESGRLLVREALFNMVTNGLATASLEPVPAAARAVARPIACPMTRADAARGEAATVNLRHERLKLDGFAQFVLPLLDGSRDLAALTSAVLDGGADGRLAFTRNGINVEEPAERLRIATENLNALLHILARAALLRV